MAQPIYVNLEFTPNPNTLKFSVNQQLLERGAANFLAASDATKSPLAKKLFGIDGVQAVMIGTTFVTITKSADGSWETLANEIPKTIEDHLGKNELVVDADWSFESRASGSGPEAEVEGKIVEILDKEIRPAVAMDGGDITFAKFENGVVYLYLQGSCSSCPSATATLKMGVEQRLKKSIPQVKEVVQV